MIRSNTKTLSVSARRALRYGVSSTTLCVASVAGLSQAVAETAVADQPQEVVVTGQQRPSLVILADKLQDTPQTVNVIPQQVLHEQGVTTLQEALKNVPGITLNSGEGGAHGDTCEPARLPGQ